MLTRRGCAHRLAWSVLAGLVLCWLADPAARAEGIAATTSPDQTATSMPDGPDYGAATPNALLESMAKVITVNGKPGQWTGFQPPASRAFVEVQLDMAAQLVARSARVAQLVESKIGKMEAGLIKGTGGGGVQTGSELTLRYQMSQIAGDGKVDWAKVKIIENGDKAQAAIASLGTSISLVKVNGKWYLGETEGQETMAQTAEGTKKMTGSLLKVLDQIEQKVNAGQITRKNFIQEYSNIINDTMGPGAK